MKKPINQDSRILINMKQFIIVFVIITLASCKAQNVVTEQFAQDEDIVLIDKDDFSGILEYDNMVVKDSKSLKRFYSQINKTRKPGLPVPIVDFSENMVIIICMGEQKGKLLPVLFKTEESDSEITFALKMVESQENETLSEIISHPFYVFKTPVTHKSVIFNKSMH